MQNDVVISFVTIKQRKREEKARTTSVGMNWGLNDT